MPANQCELSQTKHKSRDRRGVQKSVSFSFMWKYHSVHFISTVISKKKGLETQIPVKQSNGTKSQGWTNWLWPSHPQQLHIMHGRSVLPDPRSKQLRLGVYFIKSIHISLFYTILLYYSHSGMSSHKPPKQSYHDLYCAFPSVQGEREKAMTDKEVFRLRSHLCDSS